MDEKAPIPEEIRARSFVLVDEEGRVRAELSASEEGGTELVLYDELKMFEIQLWVDRRGPILSLRKVPKGVGEIPFEVELKTSDEGAQIVLHDEKGVGRMTLTVVEGCPSFSLNHEMTPTILGTTFPLPMLELKILEERPSLCLYDKQGKAKVVLWAREEGSGLGLGNNLSQIENDGAILQVIGKEGFIHLFNARGKLKFSK
jgi:hypothetical protein